MKDIKNSTVELLPIFMMFCVGMYAVPLRIMGTDMASIPGDMGDGRLNNYFLEHGYKWISGHVASFWNAPFFYPVARAISFSDNHLGTLPIYAILRFFHFDRETAYQLWFIAIFALNYLSCAWVLRKLSINAAGAAAGAYIFAFSLPVVAQIGHSQLLPRFMIPLAFYFALSYFEKPDVKTFSLACLAVIIQFYCTMYMGFFLVVGLLTMLIAFILLQKDRLEKLRRIAWSSYQSFILKTLIILLSILCLLPLIIPYYRTSLEYGDRSWNEIVTMLPRFKSYLFPAYGSLLWEWLLPMGNNLPMAHEHQMFMGAAPFLAVALLIMISIRHRSNPLVRRGMIALTTFGLLTLLTLHIRPNLYRVALFLPGLKAIRAVTRIIFLDSFLMSLAVGVVITKIAESNFIRSRYLAGAVLSVVVLSTVTLDQYVKTDGLLRYAKVDAQNRTRTIEKLIKGKDPKVTIFAYMPENSPDPAYVVHLDAMMAAQNLDIATINGYSGNFPRGYYESFYTKFGQCESYFVWEALAVQKNPHLAGRDLFAGSAIVGRDTCVDYHYHLVLNGNHVVGVTVWRDSANDHRTFTFINAALPENGYKAEITFPIHGITIARGKSFPVSAFVKNTSDTSWGALNEKGPGCQINLSYRWLSGEHSPLGSFDTRYSLPYDLSPGEQASFSLDVIAPDKPGLYYLEFDVVQELVTFFHEKGSPTALFQVTIL